MLPICPLARPLPPTARAASVAPGRRGCVRAIGVSNFTPDRAVDLGIFNQTMPQMNQIEINSFHQRQAQVEALQAEGMLVEAWAPFAEGKHDIFHKPVLTQIGAQYGKSVAQVILRWLVEYIPPPRREKPGSGRVLMQNADAFCMGSGREWAILFIN